MFLFVVWSHLGLPEPTPVQYDIATFLQHGPRRFIVQAFRGVGKSWITAAFVLWTLLIDPQKKILVVSASQPLADSFSIFCKQLIRDIPILQHLQPRADQRDANDKWDVGPATPDPAPSVKSAGITGQITGSRADLIVPDDIEIPKNSYTHLLRERLAEQVKEFDAVLKPGGRIAYLGTPQVESTIYNRLAKRGYTSRIWPAEIPADAEKYGEKLAPFIKELIASGMPHGAAVDAKRFSMDDLMERRISYGAGGYSLQFMLDTTPSESEKHPLKLRDLMVMDVDPARAPVRVMWTGERENAVQDLAAGGFDGDFYVKPFFLSKDEVADYTGCAMAVDPSGRGQDETAISVVKHLMGQLYCVASDGWVDGFGDATLQAIADTAKAHNVKVIIVEQNYGGGMFVNLLKPYLARTHPCAIEEVWHSKQKETRIIDSLLPVMRGHRLVMARTVIENDLRVQGNSERYSLIQQMTRMSRVKGALPNEDRLEALAMAVSYWREQLSRDQEKNVDKHKAKMLDIELRKFHSNVFGTALRSARKYIRI